MQDSNNNNMQPCPNWWLDRRIPYLFDGAGLRVVGRGEVTCPFVFDDAEAAWRAHASVGPVRRAIDVAGEAAVRAATTAVDRAHAQPDSTVRYENVFVWVAGERP